jgi:hypothetical protein
MRESTHTHVRIHEKKKLICNLSNKEEKKTKKKYSQTPIQPDTNFLQVLAECE